MDNNEMNFERYADAATELAAEMAEAGMRLLHSLDGGVDHDEEAAVELLAAIIELHHLDELYELEWLWKES
jgi:hypothetical protein